MTRLKQLSLQFGNDWRYPPSRELAERNMQTFLALGCVLDHYYFNLGKVDLGDTKKLIVTVPKPDDSGYAEMKCDPLGIAWCPAEIDLDYSRSLEGESLKRYVLEAVHQSVLNYANFRESDTSPCVAAYNAVIEDGLQFGFYFKKGKTLPRKSHKTKFKLYIKSDLDEIAVIAEVWESRTLLGSGVLYSTSPYLDPMATLVRKPSWTAGGSISLSPIKMSEGGAVNRLLKLSELAEDLTAPELAWPDSKPH